MKKVEIIVNGKAYPCRQTMGTMLRFRQETGKEVSEIGAGCLSDLCTFLWCCTVSACNHDGIDFSLSLMDFCDSIGLDELQSWSAAVSDDSRMDGGEEKKSR